MSRLLMSFVSLHLVIGQNPYGCSAPVVEKVLIVCPVSLVDVGISSFLDPVSLRT